MARAHLSKGNALANELSSKSERRRMLQMREQELFAQWTSTQKKLEAQAKGMMEELGSATNFVTDTRKSLDAAKSERAAQLQRWRGRSAVHSDLESFINRPPASAATRLPEMDGTMARRPAAGWGTGHRPRLVR